MNLKTLFFTLSCSLFYFSVFAQQDGYWDSARATKKEIVVSARDRIVVKTDDLPIGTTEIVFRITLLNENQETAKSLVSVLKAIPDPTGISQGSAGAVFLLSKISGNDKCTYALFSNEVTATIYQKSGETKKGCFVQQEFISKDAHRLSVDKSTCLQPNTNTIWFGFESKNWIMNQKIILEVVPWVNTKLSRGWSIGNKKLLLNQIKVDDLLKNLSNSDVMCFCVMEKLQKEYTFQEIQELLPAEKTKKINDLGAICFEKTGESKTVYLNLQNQISDLIAKENYGEAIKKLQAIINDKNANVSDYQTFGFAFIVTKQFDKAIKHLKEGEKLDDTDLLIKMNLAHAYLFKNDFRAAKSIHKKYQSQNVTDSLAWAEKVKLDFEVFKKAGLVSKDFEKVLRILN